MAMIKVLNYFLDLSFEYIMVLFIYLFIYFVLVEKKKKEKRNRKEKERNLTFWKSCDWKWKSFCFWICKYCDIIFFLFLFYFYFILFWLIGVSKKKWYSKCIRVFGLKSRDIVFFPWKESTFISLRSVILFKKEKKIYLERFSFTPKIKKERKKKKEKKGKKKKKEEREPSRKNDFITSCTHTFIYCEI